MPLDREIRVDVPGIPLTFLRSVSEAEGLSKLATVMMPRFLSAGAQWTDLTAIVPKMATLDGWVGELERLGRLYQEAAERMVTMESRRSARSLFALASLYLHFAHMVLPPDDRKQALVAASLDAYDRAGQLSDRPPRRVELQAAGRRLPVHVWPATSSSGPDGGGGAPTVVYLHGGDSGRPAALRTVDELLARGLAVVTGDLPGQGEARMMLGQTLTDAGHDFAEIVPAAIEQVALLPEVDGSRIGLGGECLGAVAAIVGGSRSDRVRAIAGTSPRFDTTFVYRKDPDEDVLGGNIFRCLTGTGEPLVPADLPRAVGDVDVPLMVVAGEQDPSSPASTWQELLATAPAPAQLVWVEGGIQVLTNAPLLAAPVVADFLAARLAEAPAPSASTLVEAVSGQ